MFGSFFPAQLLICLNKSLLQEQWVDYKTVPPGSHFGLRSQERTGVLMRAAFHLEVLLLGIIFTEQSAAEEECSTCLTVWPSETEEVKVLKKVWYDGNAKWDFYNQTKEWVVSVFL